MREDGREDSGRAGEAVELLAERSAVSVGAGIERLINRERIARPVKCTRIIGGASFGPLSR